MSSEHFTGVRPRYPAYYRMCLRPRFEVVIYGEVVDRTSTKQEAELALREALELHHYPEYPSPGLSLEGGKNG